MKFKDKRTKEEITLK